MNHSFVSCRFYLFTLLAGFCALVQPTFAQDQPKPQKVVTIEGITEYHLPNGVRFLLFPDPTASTVTVNMTVLVGSRHEGYGETGMAHLLEHMTFKGSKDFPHYSDKYFVPRGADANGTTYLDRTNYFETMPAKDSNLEFGIHFEAERLVHCFIRSEDFKLEMPVVRNEFEMGENNPFGILYQRMMSAAYEWHNYRNTTMGNRSDIERVPIDRLQAFYRRYYQPDNILLIVAGKFDEAKALGYVSQYFGTIKAPTRVLYKTYTDEPAQDGERSVILRRVGNVSLVGLMYHISSAAEEDNPRLDILARILGTEPTGRLYKALMETKKATGVSAAANSWHDPSIFEAFAQVADKSTPEEVRDIMIDVLEDFAKNPATQKEVERAKKEFQSEFELSLAKSKYIAIQLSEWASAGDWRLMFLYRDRIAKVTPEDVNRVAKLYLKQSNRTVGIFLPASVVSRTYVPPTPSIADLVKDYKGGSAMTAGEIFDPTPANIEARVKRFQLQSGIKVALLPKKTRGQSLVGKLVLHFGNEKSLTGQTSACDFLGPLMRRGTAKHSRDQIQDLLDKHTSTLSVSSGTGTLSLSWQSKHKELPVVLDLLEEVLRSPTFPEKDFDEMRRSDRQDLEKKLTDPRALAGNRIGRALNPYPNTDIRCVPTIHEAIERLDKVTLADVVKLYKEQLGGTVGELVLVGDFDADSTAKRLEAIFADWKTTVPFERITHMAHVQVAGAKEVIKTPDKEGAVYVAGLQFAEIDTAPDYPALAMGNYLLGGNLTSRLWLRLREKGGLCYGCGSQLSVDPQDPYASFLIYAICNPENVGKVDSGSLDELDKFLKKGPAAEELESGKKAYLEEQQVSRGNDSSVAAMLRKGLYLNRTFQYQADLEKKIAAVSAEDVTRAVNAHIAANRLVIVQAGDFDKKRQQ